jgi:MFS superfamily sulfate permease-like transporter
VSGQARFKVFSIAYGAAYLAFFFYSEASKAALFRYYPVLGTFSRDALPLETAGPPILWYSWLLGALGVSLAISALVPRRWAERIPPSWVAVVGAACLVVILVYERRWFY